MPQPYKERPHQQGRWYLLQANGSLLKLHYALLGEHNERNALAAASAAIAVGATLARDQARFGVSTTS